MSSQTRKSNEKDQASRDICIIRHGYYPDDARVFKEARALCEAGYSVDLICLRRSGDKRKETVDGVHVYRLSHKHERGSLLQYLYEYGLSFCKSFLLITVSCFRRGYKCVQVNTLPDVLVFSTIIPRLFGRKVLLDMHEPAPELFVTKYGPGRYRRLYKFVVLIERLSIKYANEVLTVNEALRERLITRGAYGQKIHVIRNVPDERFRPKMPRQSFGKRLTLLTHGTIAERYGQEVIIRALSFLRGKNYDLQLLIVGDGENTEQVRSLAEQLGCSDIVTFIGRVPLCQIGEFINRANVGVVPLLRSPFSELCQPNKLFEYVAYRKPVIVSRLRAVEESFDDSCVMFFEPGNHEDLARCIVELYDNPEKQHELADNAYRRYESMSWSATKHVYLKLVKDLVGK